MENENMLNIPTEKDLKALPPLGSTRDENPLKIMVYMKFFLGGWMWFIAEYDPKDRIFWGYVISPLCSAGEWKSISFDELIEFNPSKNPDVDRDLHFEPKPFFAALLEEGIITRDARFMWRRHAHFYCFDGSDKLI